MVRTTANEMDQKLVQYLGGGKPTVLATVDEKSQPYTSIMSWVVAKDSKHVRIAALKDTQTLKNIKSNGKIMLSVHGPGVNYGIRGTAKIVKESIEKAPLPLSLVEVSVDYVKDDNTPGVTVTSGITYHWEKDTEKMKQLEAQIYEEMKR